MTKAKSGNRVKVQYTGKLEDGTEFDSVSETAPLEFTIGGREVIPGFETAVVGMIPGESKTVTLPAEQAYGTFRQELVAELERKDMPADLNLEVGNQLEVTPDEGETFLVTITDLSQETVTLDANHPLAGKELTFEIKLLEVD